MSIYLMRGGMTATDIIAIYAAVVATGVLLWDVYKWRRTERVRLTGRVMTDAMLVGPGFPNTGERWISLNVDNRGHLTCTVTHLFIAGYANWLQKIRRRSVFQGIINTNGTRGNSVPHLLEPGTSFIGLALQTTEIEERSRAELLYIGIHHSGSDKPLRIRVKPITSRET
jgi:hypothetical protein